MAKNLGPDSEGEDEEVWEDDGMMGRVGEIWAGEIAGGDDGEIRSGFLKWDWRNDMTIVL
jgi:hypothetical protein